LAALERKGRIMPPIQLLLATLVACAAVAGGQGDGADNGGEHEMWVELSEPVATAELAPEARAARIARIDAEQTRLVAQLGELGIETVTRTRHVRNAVLVIMSPEQVEAVSRLPGVRRIVPAAERNPPETHVPDPARE
jgi:hypothetical protein